MGACVCEVTGADGRRCTTAVSGGWPQVLEAAGGRARIVLDPVPYLATQVPPLDRNGIPMLVHMTFKNKDAFFR